MNFKPIFQDSDCLICFLEVNEYQLLEKLFDKIFIPQSVFLELTRDKSPNIVKNI